MKREEQSNLAHAVTPLQLISDIFMLPSLSSFASPVLEDDAGAILVDIWRGGCWEKKETTSEL